MKRLKNKFCTPLQKIKEGFFHRPQLYALVCWAEKVIVGRKWIGVWRFEKRDRRGRLISRMFAYNAANLVDQGEESMLRCFFLNELNPAGFEIGLFNDTVVEGDTPATLVGEPTGNGYARLAVERSSVGFPTVQQVGGNWQVTSKVVTFSAIGGAWGPVTAACLITTDATKRLVSFVDMSQSHTLQDGETLGVSVSIQLA